jgi:hypothetical protein
MRKTLLCVVLFILAAVLLTSCIEYPEEPREFKPFCQEQYELLLVEEPGLPRSFVGYCIQTLQTGDEMLGVQRFCGYLVDNGEYLTIKECVQDLLTQE